MVYPAANRGGGRREGFGAGRMGRGAGRTGGRTNVWQRSQRGRGPGGSSSSHEAGGEEQHQGQFERGTTDHATPIFSSESGKRAEENANWERAAEKNSGQFQGGFDDKWAHREEMVNNQQKHNDENSAKVKDMGVDQEKPEGKIPSKTGCSFCGLKNHSTEECKKKNACELCGLNSHGAFECRREPLWNFGPELCAAQVPDQSFFFIEEQIDHRALKEKSSTAIITVTNGEINARQIEQEFRNILSPDLWRWNAKQVADNKFTMRFPNAKMVQEYSNFKLGMKHVDAQIMIEPWSSSLGAKGVLQQAWFKVKGIPPDQRGTRTIAKVAGLVGKAISIDESTRYKPEYVRIKIACRDIYEVPDSAESTLGMFLYDFYFELEEFDQFGKKPVKIQVPTEKEEPSPKKMKTGASEFDISNRQQVHGNFDKDGEPSSKCNTGGSEKQQKASYCQSAPSKISFAKCQLESVPHVDFGINDMEEGEVIPAATYEPSKDLSDNEDSSTSDDFANQVHQAFSGKDVDNTAVWQFSCATFVQKGNAEHQSFKDNNTGKSSVRITEINDGEATEVVVNNPRKENPGSLEACDMNLKELINPYESIKAQRVERRYSERVQKKLVTEKKDLKIINSRKRSSEGLFKDELQGRLLEGVQVLLSCAHKVMAKDKKTSARLMLKSPDDQEQDPED
ncbi:unnamed protein product [Urochloa humidicola]